MLFGRSLFGGALVAGYITVVGAANCSALATAEALVTFQGKGAGVAEATIPPAQAVRSAVEGNNSILASAIATGHAHVEFRPSGFAVATATGVSSSKGIHNATGSALADAIGHANGYRRIRMPFQPPAKAYAYAEADAVSYIIGYTKPAIANAYAFGTTYFVGQVKAIATATATADAVMTVGATQEALADAYGEATCLYTAGAQAKVRATATLFGDATITHNGVKYVEFFGKGFCEATALISTTTVFQPQVGHADATGYAKAVQIYGLKGSGIATATGTGDGVIVLTGVSAQAAVCTATATGKASRKTLSNGTALAIATAHANLTAFFKDGGTGLATADAYQHGLRIAIGRVPTAFCDATVIGSGTKTQMAATNALAEAIALGYNQINDFDRAPIDRTVYVDLQDRLVSVDLQDRIIIV